MYMVISFYFYFTVVPKICIASPDSIVLKCLKMALLSRFERRADMYDFKFYKSTNSPFLVCKMKIIFAWENYCEDLRGLKSMMYKKCL